MTERFERFTVLINKISRSVKRIKNQEMSDHGLRATHVSCLDYLSSPEPVTATDLCERCEEDKATISRAIDYLECNGYLIRDAKHPKRYKSPLVLTEKGWRVAEKISAKINAVLDEISVELTEEQRIAFYKSLALISDRLDVICRRFDETE